MAVRNRKMQRYRCTAFSASVVVSMGLYTGVAYADTTPPKPVAPKRGLVDVVKKTVKAGEKIVDNTKKTVTNTVNQVNQAAKKTGELVINGIKHTVDDVSKNLSKFALPPPLLPALASLTKCVYTEVQKDKSIQEMIRKPGPQSMANFAMTTTNNITALLKDLRQFEFDKLQFNSVSQVVDSSFNQMSKVSARQPILQCFINFARPFAKDMAPKLDNLLSDVKTILLDIYRNVIEPKVQELVSKLIVQGLGVVVGPEAERIIQSKVTKYIYHPEKFEQAPAKIEALATALKTRQNLDQALSEARTALTPAPLQRSRFAYEVVKEVVIMKARKWVRNPCFGDDGGKDNQSTKSTSANWWEQSSFDWAQSPGFALNQTVIQKLENRIPGGQCIVDYGIKAMHAGMQLLRSAVGSACHIAPDAGSTVGIVAYGLGAIGLGSRVSAAVTAACNVLIEGMDEVIKYTGSPVLKSKLNEALQFVTDKLIDEGAKLLDQELTRNHFFEKADAKLEHFVSKGGTFGKMLQRAIDGALMRLIEENGYAYIEKMNAYNGAILELATKAVTKAKSLPAAPVKTNISGGAR